MIQLILEFNIYCAPLDKTIVCWSNPDEKNQVYQIQLSCYDYVD